jgi:hypothetical protein
VESGDLVIQAQFVQIGKKLGIGKFGRIACKQMEVGSIFSLMANLPAPSKEENIEIDQQKTGLVIQNTEQLRVDNLQGVVYIQTESKGSITINTIESGKLAVVAPQSDVSIHLKSLIDNSFISAKSVELILTEDFDSCTVVDSRSGKQIVTASEQMPSLFIDAERVEVLVLSRFEILKKQITEKLELKRINKAKQ